MRSQKQGLGSVVLVTFVGCATASHVYPPATVQSFNAECRENMWNPNSAVDPEIYCQCMLSGAQARWDTEKLNRILVRSRTGGWGTGFIGIGGGRVP